MAYHLHFVLQPTLWLHDEEGNFIQEVTHPQNWGPWTSIIDQRIAEDRTGVKHIFMGDFDYRPFRYHYDLPSRLIHVWVRRPEGQSLDVTQLSNLLHDISPEGYAPDTWMEGDLGILSDEEARQLGLSGVNGVELVPRVVAVYEGWQGNERAVDLSQLPRHSQ